ncbi:MAG: hypothetical protein GWN18_20000, partial [Thermoplasmata archaeon]|nr:hypothetical protein [Thermoplasmata archaeon]NIV83909.1 hypothetical protein [Gemmatimonadota bacterium]NIS14411.1 hypothetical protein [Thermoplasmata archaeon]NIS22255.1 hypothetical protein [Thermoplasmata archaeon]NIT80138.1 hypothetical protein [Thermoplasmata archaeon]
LSKYKSQGLERTVDGPCRYHKECNCPIADVCPKHGGPEQCATDDPC